MPVSLKRMLTKFREVFYSRMIQDVIYNALNLLFILLAALTVISGFNLFFNWLQTLLI